ncbi:hypothetical protein KCP71_23015 [Salmonella enterica subsp. enterica]|nr:hypothetical protein KCP71_23015 [Salmonella enterica subsp. enterica]
MNVEVCCNPTRSPVVAGFLPDNRVDAYYPERGQLRHWQTGKGLSDPLAGVPKVWANGQGGCWTSCWRSTLPSRAASGWSLLC